MLCFLGPAFAHEEPFWTCKLTLEGLLHLWSHDLTVQDCISTYWNNSCLCWQVWWLSMTQGNWMMCLCFSKQPWNAFDDSFGKVTQASFEHLLQKGEPLVPAQTPPTIADHHQYNNTSEVMLLHVFFFFLLEIQECTLLVQATKFSFDNFDALMWKKATEWCVSFCKQLWNAFDDSTGNLPQASLQNFLQKNDPLVPTHKTPTSGDIQQYKNSEVILLHDFFERLDVFFTCWSNSSSLLVTYISWHKTTERYVALSSHGMPLMGLLEPFLKLPWRICRKKVNRFFHNITPLYLVATISLKTLQRWYSCLILFDIK